MRTALEVLTPWPCKKAMISRITFWSAPTGGNPRRTLGTNPFDLKQFLGLTLDNLENRFAEGDNQPAGEGRADSFDETRSQISFHPFS